ncbi:MAG: O-antigen ligase family protein, partial [Cetobacterium sp.]
KSGHLNVESKVIKKVQSIFTIKGNQSNYQRVLMWRRGGYIFLENPLLGIGVDSFYSEAGKDKYLDIKHKDEKFNKNFNHIHNEYIHQLISRGIFGAMLFFGLWYYILKSFRKSKDKEFDITLLIIYSVYGIFDSYSVRIDSIFIYIFIGITFINTLKEETEKNRVIEKLAYFSTIAIFLVGLYFNKRFRYYFLISLVLYLIHYLYKKRKRVKL